MVGRPLRCRRLSAIARRAKEDRQNPTPKMPYIYQLQSVTDPSRFYTGSTDYLKARLESYSARHLR